jgi:hypothetical protein
MESNTQGSPVSGLLRLPREIRNQIFSYLFIQAREPPPHPPPTKRYRHRGKHDILYIPNDEIVRELPLRFINHQIRSEVTEQVETLHKAGKATVKLDLMVKGYLFWPTITRIPALIPATRTLNLDVDLRVFSTESFRSNDGWPRQPGAGFRSLYSLLNTFLRYGPDMGFGMSTTHGQSYGSRCVEVNTLTINVSFHDLYTPATWPDTAQQIREKVKTLAQSYVPRGHVRRVCLSITYQSNGTTCEMMNEWDVPRPSSDNEIVPLEQWDSHCPMFYESATT